MRINALRRRAIVPVIVVDGYQDDATWTLDDRGLASITAYDWQEDGVSTGDTTATVPTPLSDYVGTRLKCVITYDGGQTIETPAQKVHAPHTDTTHNDHDDDLLDYVAHEKMSFFAKQTGDWSNTSTWHGNVVPTENSSVLIPYGIVVTLDVDSEFFQHDRVRVDGELQFAQDQDIKFLVHTIIGEQGSVIQSGTSGSPLSDSYSHTVIWADRAPRKDKTAATNPDLQTDPELLSGGLISLGTVLLRGRVRDTWNLAKPMASGSTQATIVDYRGFGRPALYEGLRVDDVVVIGGTQNSWSGTSTSIEGEDEEVTVTGISTVDGGHLVTFAPPLEHDHIDHTAGRSDCYVAMGVYKTANIIFRSVSTADKNAGHFMMMHGMCEFDIRGVDFWDMGRTSKREGGGAVKAGELFDNTPGGLVTQTLYDNSNIIGRYSGPHFHRCGGRLATDGIKQREIHECAVYDAVGWGIVHHDCYMNMSNCFVYKFWGAAYSAEQGSETGEWRRLCAMRTTNNSNDPLFESPINWQSSMKGNEQFAGSGDPGRAGWGAFMKSRDVRLVDSYFGSCGAGVVFHHRGTSDPEASISVMLDHLRIDSDYKYLTLMEDNYDHLKIHTPHVPVRHLDNIRLMGNIRAIEVTKTLTNQDHDNSILWTNHVEFGSKYASYDIEYIGTYLLQWCQTTNSATGMSWGTNTTQVGNINCQMINDIGVDFKGSGDSGAIIDNFSADDFRWINVAPVYECATPETGSVPGYAVTNTDWTTIRHLDEQYGNIDWDTDPSTTFPLKACDWDGGSTISNKITNSDGKRVDGINSLAEISPKPWFSTGDITGPGYAGSCADYQTLYGFWKDTGGRDILVCPRVISARDSGRNGIEWYTVEGTTLDAFGGSGDPDYNGVFTFSANPIVQADIYTTCAKGGTVDITPNATATGGDGTISVLDMNGNHIQRQSNNGDIDWVGETVTFTPDVDFYGATSFVTSLHSAGQAKVVIVNILVDTDEGQETPLVGTHFTMTAGVGKFDLALLDIPNCYPRRPRDVVYSTDSGTTWRLAAIYWSQHTWPITVHSDGTALTAGSVTVDLKYVTDHDRIEVSAASVNLTIL